MDRSRGNNKRADKKGEKSKGNFKSPSPVRKLQKSHPVNII